MKADRRRGVRRAGWVLVAVGLAVLAWGGVTIFWQEPFTGLYAGREQARLEAEYAQQAPRFRDVADAEARNERAQLRALRRAARAYRLELPEGKAMGRLTVPRLGLKRIVINGASIDDLKTGPGRDVRSFMPGEGKLVYIAGHRTTYGAPFRHIDDLRRKDWIHLEVPYGRFAYRVTGRVIVTPDDVNRLRPRGREELALQASHPPYSAKQRYIVYAKLVKVRPALSS